MFFFQFNSPIFEYLLYGNSEYDYTQIIDNEVYGNSA